MAIPDSADLKYYALRGARWTGTANLCTIIFQVIQMMILARLLTPRDFGLVAVANVAAGLALLFVDAGITNAIVYRRDADRNLLSSLYWVNLGMGAMICLLITGTAPLVARFYHETELAHLLRLTGFALLLVAAGQQYHALLLRDLRYRGLAAAEVIAGLVGLCTAVVSARAGNGAASLIHGLVLRSGTQSLLLLAMGWKDHRPRLVFQREGLGFYLQFGLYQMGEKLANYFNSQLDTLLLGRLAGADALGYYSLAKNLALRPQQLINPIVGRVTFPLMACMNDDQIFLRRAYLKGLRYLAHVNFPIHLLLAVLAAPTVRFLYGPGWEPAVLPVTLLALWALVRSTFNPVGGLLLACGRARRAFLWNFLMLFLVIPMVVYAVRHGIEGVAAGYLIFQTLLVYPAFRVLVRPCTGATFREYFSGQGIPFLQSLLAAGGALAVHRGLPPGLHPLAALFIPGLAGLTLFVLLAWKSGRDFREDLLATLTARPQNTASPSTDTATG